jgi:DNA invertase Pin-like site-specific DNA recombinase
LADLVRLIAELEQRKINFESLTEKIETRSPAGWLVFLVFAALAEFERNLIRERTVAGLKAARALQNSQRKRSKPSAPCSKPQTFRLPKSRPASALLDQPSTVP